MKLTTLILLGSACAFFSACNNQTGNPYGAPEASIPTQNNANPYAAPQANGETGNYANAPYQQLPGVGNTLPPTQPPTHNHPYTAPASSNTPTAAAPIGGSTIPHKVVSGDSLWKLARDYNTTVSAIQAANGMTNANIRLGETIQIPNN